MNIVDAKMETGTLRSGRGNKSEGKVRNSFLTAQKYHISPWIYRREIIWMSHFFLIHYIFEYV